LKFSLLVPSLLLLLLLLLTEHHDYVDSYSGHSGFDSRP
jgi:hypothetical protein